MTQLNGFLVLGATSVTGRHVAAQAHWLRALIKTPGKLTAKRGGSTFRQGSIRDPIDLAS